MSCTAGLLGPVSREHGPVWPTEPSWRHVPVATTSSGDACVNGLESVSRDLENLSCNLKPSPPVSFPWILPSPINLAFLLLPHLLGREEGTVTEGSAGSGQTPPGTSEPRTEALWAEAPPTPAPPPLTPGTEPWPFPHSSPRPTHPPGGAPSHPQGAVPALLLPWGLGARRQESNALASPALGTVRLCSASGPLHRRTGVASWHSCWGPGPPRGGAW